ncbi:MAG TPA: hypothetical protein EYN66_05610 [Myxococcales bacterium]|nr:hypothetical protein [Myxococcales bacterium]
MELLKQNRRTNAPCFVGEGTPQDAVLVQIGFLSCYRGESGKEQCMNIWIPAPAMPCAPWIIRGLLFRSGWHMENVGGLWAQIMHSGSSVEDSMIDMDI